MQLSTVAAPLRAPKVTALAIAIAMTASTLIAAANPAWASGEESPANIAASPSPGVPEPVELPGDEPATSPTPDSAPEVSPSPSVGPDQSEDSDLADDLNVGDQGESDQGEAVGPPDFVARYSALMLASVPAGNVEGGTAQWAVSQLVSSAITGFAAPNAAGYVSPASVGSTAPKISSWGAGSGQIDADGAAQLEFSGTAVLHASTGGGWLRISDLQADLDATGNGTVSAVVAYGTSDLGSPGNRPYDASLTPVRGPVRVDVLSLTGNDANQFELDGTDATWTNLSSTWHSEFLAFVSGVEVPELSPAAAAWSYQTTLTGATATSGASAGLLRTPAPITLALTVEPTPEPVVYGITVSPVEDVEPGDTVTIDGTLPATYAGKPTGIYVYWCVEGGNTVGTADGRLVADQDCTTTGQQVLSSVSQYGGAIPATGTVEDGIWTFSVTATAPESILTNDCVDATCGIFVRLDHNWNSNPSSPYYVTEDIYAFDQFVAVAYAQPIQYGITVSPVEDVEAGDTVTIDGTLPATYAGKPTGIYVYWCVEGGNTVGTADGRLVADQDCTTTGQQVLSSVSQYGGAIPATGTVADGVWTFSVPATAPESILTNDCVDATCGIFVRLDHNWNSNPSSPYYVTEDIYAFDQFVAVAYKDTSGGGDTGGGDTGGGDTGGGENQGGTPTPPVAVGTLVWGIESGFRDYITSDIASGGFTTSGASFGGGVFVFTQTGGNANPAAGSGTNTYGGSVHFTGHDGALDLRFSTPQVRLTSTTSAVLSLSANGSRVDFATLNLGAATRTENNGAVRFAGAPATLTAAGAAAFQNFYSAGHALDPVTVSFGASGTASGGSSVGNTTTSSTNVAVPLTPPATDGIVLDDETLQRFLAGEVVTIAVDGYEPGEQVAVVLYSTPTVLARVTAGPDGVATWTGSLPAGTTGNHTLVMIGFKIAKGMQFSVEAASPGECSVTSTHLAWGFKEGFRAYLDSTLADGRWELDQVAYESEAFTWTGGTGNLAEGPAGSIAYPGSVRFVAHGGVLDTTLSNPTVLFTKEGAYLLLTVTGETQDGVAVSQEGVRFAELDLAGGELSTDGQSVVFAGIPAVLTEEGSAAFGTYPAGEVLDPIAFSVSSDSGCALTLFGQAGAEPEETVSPTPTDPEPAAPAETGSGTNWLPWVIAAVAAIVLAAVVFLTRRSGARN